MSTARIESLKDAQKAALNELQGIFPEAKKEELWGFLKYRDYDVNKAELQYRDTLSWRYCIYRGSDYVPTSLLRIPLLRRHEHVGLAS
jgi:hypothetical protein